MSAIAIKWVSEQHIGNNHAKHLLLFLATHNFHTPGVFFKIDTIAKQLELSVRAVQRAFNILENLKLILREYRFNKETKRQITNGYYLNIPQEYVDKFFGEHREGDYCAPLGVSNRRGEGDQWTPGVPKKPSKTTNESNTCETHAAPNNNSINNNLISNSLGVKKRTLSKKKSKRKPEIRLPDEFTYNENHKRLAQELNVDINHEFELFKDYALQNDRMLCDWNAGFRHWLRKTKDFKPRQKLISSPKKQETSYASVENQSTSYGYWDRQHEKSHGSEARRDNIGGNGVRTVKDYLLS
jgi:Helix-turn-helix domain